MPTNSLLGTGSFVMTKKFLCMTIKELISVPVFNSSKYYVPLIYCHSEKATENIKQALKKDFHEIMFGT